MVPVNGSPARGAPALSSPSPRAGFKPLLLVTFAGLILIALSGAFLLGLAVVGLLAMAVAACELIRRHIGRPALTAFARRPIGY